MREDDWLPKLYIEEFTKIKEKKDVIQSKRCENNQRPKIRKTTSRVE